VAASFEINTATPKSMVESRLPQVFTILAVLISLGWWARQLVLRPAEPLRFDDAYMFYRYAIHIRQGLGMTWNLDGVHTYGETSPLWGFAVLFLSYLPMSMSNVLIFGSWLCSLGAIIALAWATARNARSAYLSSTWRALPITAILFFLFHMFRVNAFTGMETMLGALLCAVYVGLVLGWAEGGIRPQYAGLTGVLIFLVRPEAAIAVVLMPALAYALLPGTTRKGVATLLSVFLLGFVLDLIICKLYFGTPLPLSYYMKTRQGYEGYHTSWAPARMTFVMLWSCWPYLCLLAVFTRGRDLRRTAVCLLPAAAVFAYLSTVTQIMGMDARYYVPYLPFIAVPALLSLDRRLAGSAPHEKPFRFFLRAAIVAGAAAAVFAVLLVVKHPMIKLQAFGAAIDRRLEHREIAYDPVHFEVAAARPLPARYWFTELEGIGNVLVKPLPKGSTVAASEVGLLGALAPDVNVIDLAGLNDPQIALHGFSLDALLARKPDIIWMPHTDYTYQRGLILGNPELLRQYDVFAGAFAYGMALRKDSPARPLIDRQMQKLWNLSYPGIAMEDYLVKSASWTGKKHKISLDDNKNIEDGKDRLEPIHQVR
jgi:hypothetical protein